MHSAAFDLSGASKGNRMCPWGAPSSISRNSPPLLAALLLNSRRRRSLPFFSFRPFPSRFPSVLADSVLGESRLASSERSNIGPGRCSLALFTLALFFCSVSSSAHPSHQRAPLLSLSLSFSPFHSLASPLLSSLLFPPSHGTPPDFFFFFVPPLFTRPFHRAPRPFQPFFPSLVLTRTYSPLSSFIGLRCLAMAIQR